MEDNSNYKQAVSNKDKKGVLLLWNSKHTYTRENCMHAAAKKIDVVRRRIRDWFQNEEKMAGKKHYSIKDQNENDLTGLAIH